MGESASAVVGITRTMKHIDHHLVNNLSAKAAETDRLRLNHNFHEGGSDTLQRMLNALAPSSYVQPHKHQNPDKREAFLILAGSLLVVEFDEAGHITDHVVLNHAAGQFGAEIAARTWHTIIALEPGTVAYELKDGPWDPADDKYFASWAPSEASGEGAAFVERVLNELGLIA